MLFIHNDMVEEILNMEDCIAAQEQAFRDLAEGKATHRPLPTFMHLVNVRMGITVGVQWKAAPGATWRSA